MLVDSNHIGQPAGSIFTGKCSSLIIGRYGTTYGYFNNFHTPAGMKVARCVAGFEYGVLRHTNIERESTSLFVPRVFSLSNLLFFQMVSFTLFGLPVLYSFLIVMLTSLSSGSRALK